MNLGSKTQLHTLREEPGFASLSVDVSMGPEEGLESCSLIKQWSITTSPVIRSMIFYLLIQYRYVFLGPLLRYVYSIREVKITDPVPGTMYIKRKKIYWFSSFVKIYLPCL
jgi:hypothetical protein